MSTNRLNRLNILVLKPELKDYIYNILSVQVNNPDKSTEQKIFDYLTNLPGQVYRHVKSRKTLKVDLDKSYFIKTHQPLSLKEILKNLTSFKCQMSNALDEQRAINALKKLNVQTLDIAGYGETVGKFHKRNNHSFLITEAIEPNVSLDQLLETKKNTKDYFKLKRLLIKFIAETTRLLHNNGLNHRDYYACHYLLKLSEDQDGLQALPVNITDNLYLIDLHRMQIRTKTPVRYIIKDLSSLLFSVRDFNFTKTDYIRFIKYYSNDYNNQKKQTSFWEKIVTKASKLREKG